MLSDKEVIKNILSGNKESYSYLVNKYKNMVFSICFRILENKEEAEDITQEVFIKAFYSLKKHNLQSKFSNWLYRIAYTTSISKKRKFKFQKIRIEETINNSEYMIDNNTAFQNTEKEERKKIIKQALLKLSLDERLLINMFYYLDCSIEEISYITNQSKDYIKLKLFRTKKKMYQLLKPHLSKSINP